MLVAALGLGCGLASGGGDVDRAGAGPGPGEASSQPPAEPPAASPVWQLPEGGVAVDSVPESVLRAVDAFGNLWLDGCAGLFVVHPGGIQRYRYLDTSWVSGASSITADEQGRVWLSDDSVRRIEAGQVQVIPLPDAPRAELAFGSDGAVWAIEFDETRMESGWFNFRQYFPTLGPQLPAPRWASNPVVARDGAFWVHADEEIYHFADGRFWGPYAFPSRVPSAYHDPQDDTLGVSYDGTLRKLAFDGGQISVVEQRDFPWIGPIGRLRDGRLVVQGLVPQGASAQDLRVFVVEDGQVTAEPIVDEDVSPRLSATRELYLQTRRGVSRYHEGQLERVIDFDFRQQFQPPDWQIQGYGPALRAASQAATWADLEPLVPPLLHRKLQLTGRMYVPGFEAPLVIDLGEDHFVELYIDPELSAFAEAKGLQLIPPFDHSELVLGEPPTKGEPWDLYGYLEPSSCDLSPRDKYFHLVEAYPVSMPAAQRASLAAALRAAHPN